MALVLKDRVRESSTTSGTGSITLAGAFTGYQTFASVIPSGSTVYYTIHNTTSPNDGEWEVGVGTFTSPSTLSRDTVLSSSAGGTTKVSFSGSSLLEVFITQPAEQAIYINDATGKVEVFGNGTNVVTFTEINTTNLTANTVTLTAGTITTNAASATDIVNKQYVDGIVSAGVHYHEPVLVESPTALNAVYVQPNGAGNGVGATLTNNGANAALVVDGITLSNTARVLVYTQANAVQNGIYTVTNEGAPDTPGPGAKWVLTRATDADTYVVASSAGLSEGSTVYVQSGDTGAGEVYTCNTQGTITFGSTNITFAQIGSAQIYSAGTGLSLTNTTFSISNTAVTAAQYGNDGNVAQITVNAQGQLTNAANVAINASSITVGTLANARTTASDANGASTIVARDATGSFTANTVTATDVNSTNVTATTGSFTNVSGNGAAISAINASNISSGTIANARTTASTSNSASTIVARDANGSFGANIVSASFSGDGSAISAINASNISSGTIANARTTAASANGASTIVQRDSGGNFSANTITANISGDISGGTNINASNITSGTIANARTTASSSNGASTIVLRDAGGAFAAGAITGTSFSGNGAAITAINASAITTGTLDNARTSASSANGDSTIVARDANGSFAANTVTATNVSITTGLFGNGSNTAPSIAFTNSTGTGLFLPAANTIAFTEGGTEAMRIDSAGNVGIGTGSPSGSDWNANSTVVQVNKNDTNGGLFKASSSNTNFVFSAGNNLAYIATTTNTPITLSTNTTERMRIFASGGVSIGNTTDPGATNLSVTGTIAGNGAPLTGINASNISSGTISNARTTAASANGASTIVTRDASGNFAGNVITATTFSGGGGSISAINASNLSSGTVATARLASGTANSSTYLRGDQTWATVSAGTLIPAGTVMIFGQTAAPTGFTKDTTNFNNSALRVVTGTVSSGGSVDFTTAFASQAVAGTIANTTATGSVSITAITATAGATTLSTSQIPSHTHRYPNGGGGIIGSNFLSGRGFDQSTEATGGGGSHDHAFSFSSGTASFTGTAHNHTFTGTAINLAVRYVDVIRATKD